MAGGLAGVVSRSVTNSAIRSATSKTDTKAAGTKSSGGAGGLVGSLAGGIGGHMYAASVSKGGGFANSVIGSVAAGSLASVGSMTGEKAAEALTSYMGYAALEESADTFPASQMWKSAADVSPVRKSPRNTQRALLSACTIPTSM